MGGLFGSGASEVARIVAGVVPATRGSVQLHGDSALLDLRGRPYSALESGVAYLSSDRAHEGGIPTLSLQENTFLPTVRKYWGKRALERRRMTEALDLLTVRPPIPELSFGLLSGGNQQKVLLAKLLLTSPRLLVLDDPTVGVDPQSREAIFAVIQEVVRTGRGALVVSSEPDQLARICDRILIIANGTIVDELVGEEVENAEVAIGGAG
jgi:ribose transport system ATP-binding protein